MSAILLSSLLIMMASLTGVIFTWKILGRFVEKNLQLLVSFSAGVFLVLSLSLSNEVIEHSISSIVWIVLGALLILVLFRSIPYFHHHHDQDEDAPHDHLDARRILTGDGLHNLGDGILIASAYIINPVLGITATISVFIHEVIQEISEFFVLRQAGYSVRKALATNFLVSGTIVIGSLGAFFLFESFENLEIPLLGISAGAFLVVVFHDLIPHSVRSLKKSAQHAHHIFFFFCGIALMLSIGIATADFHTHEVYMEESPAIY